MTVLREVKMKWENMMMDLYGYRKDARQIKFSLSITEGLNDHLPQDVNHTNKDHKQKRKEKYKKA